MRQLPYNNSAAALRFEFPSEWDATAITGLTLTITDRDGESLLAADACTLYTATSLDGAVDAFAKEITLDSAAGALSPGDPILIAGVAGPETARVKGYDSSGYVATLEVRLDNDHEDGDAVYGLYATYDLDTSDTDDFPKGLVCTLIWTPAGIDAPAVTETAQIAYTALDIEGLNLRFSRLYPRAFRDLIDDVDRLDDIRQEAEKQIDNELAAAGMDIQRIIDMDVITPAIMAKMALMSTYSGDEQMRDEREFYGLEYDRQIAILKNNPVWQDQNQDLTEDDDETTSHEWLPERGW